MKSEEMYYLMHRDDMVTAVFIEEVSGSITKIASGGAKELLPLGGNLSPDDLKKWWKRRAVPIKQGNIEKILSAQGITTPQNFLVQNLGVSLSDHYWMKPVDSDFSWNQINLFSNDFKDEIGELQFGKGSSDNEKIDLVGRTVFYPSASAQGELQKKWVLQDGSRYLVKGNHGESCQQSINEVIATLLHKKQNKMPYTSYQLCDIEVSEGKGLGCICKDFATTQIEFIPAYDVASSVKKDNAMSEYEHFIYVCRLHGLHEDVVRPFLEYQILTDFILTNTDRHFNNFGVLRDSSTLEFIGMAPIFDSGNSMFWNCPRFPEHNHLLNIEVSSFVKREVDLLKYVTDTKLVDTTLLPNSDELRALLEMDEGYEWKIDGILTGYQKKIDLLKCLQKGDKVWKYNYKS